MYDKLIDRSYVYVCIYVSMSEREREGEREREKERERGSKRERERGSKREREREREREQLAKPIHVCLFISINLMYLCMYIIPDIGLGVRVFANGPGDLGSIPGRVIPKTQKMVLDASLLNTQHYKVRIKGKVEQSRERISALPYTLV